MLGRRWNGQHPNYSVGLQDVGVSCMKPIPSGNRPPPPNASTALLLWKEVKASTTMGVVHFLNLVFVDG